MAELWDAELAIDEALAGALVAEQFPQLAPVRVTPFSWGYDNAAFLVNDEWVFRFPRRRVAVPLVERETRLLPALAPHLPLPIPIPEHVGRATERFRYPFSGYRLLRGTTACRADLTAAEYAATAETLGRVLAALHAFPVAQARSAGIGDDLLGRLDVPMRIEKTRRNLADLRGFGLLTDAMVGRFERILEATPAVAPTRHVLLHGDLYARHLLIDERRQLCGVIDWGDAHIGHPASDLEIAHSFLPAGAHDAFRSSYGEIDEVTWKLARFRALGHLTFVLRFAHLIDDAALRREGLRALENISH